MRKFKQFLPLIITAVAAMALKDKIIPMLRKVPVIGEHIDGIMNPKI